VSRRGSFQCIFGCPMPIRWRLPISPRFCQGSRSRWGSTGSAACYGS